MKATTLLPGTVWACLLQIANCLHKNKDHPDENKDILLLKCEEQFIQAPWGLTRR